jgi:hypothetical protein
LILHSPQFECSLCKSHASGRPEGIAVAHTIKFSYVFCYRVWP